MVFLFSIQRNAQISVRLQSINKVINCIFKISLMFNLVAS